MAIIADNKPGENPGVVIMVDDGSGHSISIPSVLISYNDAEKLKEYLKPITKDDELTAPIIMEVRFEMYHPDDRVEYDLWYSSSDLKGLQFISSMRKF